MCKKRSLQSRTDIRFGQPFYRRNFASLGLPRSHEARANWISI